MFYKALGYVVWNGARFYVKRRYAPMVPSRSTMAAGFVGAAVVGMALASSRSQA